MPDMTDAIFEDEKGILIVIEVTAGAKTSQFPAGYNEWRNAVGCRVTAPASEGKANKAVTAIIGRTLGVPVSAVSIVSGMTTSQKRVRIDGVSKSRVAGLLTSMQSTPSHEKP